MAWRIYAWSMLLLAVITLVGRIGVRLRRPAAVANWDLFEAAFNLVLIPGLFGFVYQRACLGPLFWEIITPLAWAAAFYGLSSPTHRRLARKRASASPCWLPSLPWR